MIRGRILSASFDGQSTAIVELDGHGIFVSSAPFVMIFEPPGFGDDDRWQTELLDRLSDGRFCPGHLKATPSPDSTRVDVTCTVHGPLGSMNTPTGEPDCSDQIRAFVVKTTADHQLGYAAEVVRLYIATQGRSPSRWRRWLRGVE